MIHGPLTKFKKSLQNILHGGEKVYIFTKKTSPMANLRHDFCPSLGKFSKRRVSLFIMELIVVTV